MSNAIRDLREQAQIGQTDFARRLGISQGRLSNYERGDRPLPVPIARRALAELAAVGVNATLDDVYPEPPKARRPSAPATESGEAVRKRPDRRAS